MSEATIKALAPWFGANRMLAAEVGKALRGCNWVGIPFAGGMSEVLHIQARTILVNDLHSHVINLARVVSDPQLGPRLYRRLRRAPFHPWTLETAQRACATYQASESWDSEARLNFAEMYFICCWMGRSGKAGTSAEFKGQLPIRWNANGGDSNVRFRSAAASLREWTKALVACNFSTLDVFDFLERVIDAIKTGVYCDPPFPEVGGEYLHQFGPDKHRLLAKRLTQFKATRVVCRFYDHPLIRDLYAESDGWKWQHLAGRDQANQTKPEVLIVRN